MPRLPIDFSVQRVLACVVWTGLWLVLYLSGLFMAALVAAPPERGYVRVTVLAPNSGAYDVLAIRERGIYSNQHEQTVSGTTSYRLHLGDVSHTCVEEVSNSQRRGLRPRTPGAGLGESFGPSWRPNAYLAWYESIGLDSGLESAGNEAAELSRRRFPSYGETEAFRVLYQDTVYDYSIPGHEPERLLPTFTQVVFFVGWLWGIGYVFTRRTWPF